MAHLIEEKENQTIGYPSLVLQPKDLAVLASELALAVVSELAKEPGCAMDVAKRLGQHEQKIYYHMRRLESVGIIKQIASEKRLGMTAKIYSLTNPVIAAKLTESGYPIKDYKSIEIAKFLNPFVKSGILNALIVMGDPYPHGRYESSAHHGAHITDFAIFLGLLLKDMNQINYKFDTQVNEKDLQGNLILFGNPKVNTITDRINPHLPIYFDKDNEWALISRLSGESYSYDTDAVVLKIKNPFNKESEILLLAGKRSIGLRSAVLACIHYGKEIDAGNKYRSDVKAKVVRGIDKNSDGIIDDVKFLE
jgi:hypothetical protein